MTLHSFFKKLTKEMPVNPNYVGALLTGYGLMGVTIVLQLILVPLYLKYLGQEGFGILLMIMAGTNYAAVGVGWLSGGLARILAERAAIKDFEGFRSAYVFSKWMNVLYSISAVIIFWILFHFFISERVVDENVTFTLLLASVSFVLQYEYNADRAAFISLHWQSKNNIREILGNSVFAICTVLTLKAELGLIGVISAQIVGILTTRILALNFWANSELGLRWERPSYKLKDLWQRVTGKMGIHYAIYAILMLTLQADTLILGWLLGPSDIALLFMIWRIPEVIVLIIGRIPGTYSPFLIALDAKSEHEELQKKYKIGLISISLFALIAAISYSLVGPWVVNLWVGNNAPSDAWLYVWASFALFFLAVTKWPSEVAYSLLNTKILILIIAIETILKLFFISIFHNSLGFITPVIGTVIIHGFLVFYLYLWLGKKTIERSSSIKQI